MSDFFDKESYTQEDISNLIKTKSEEGPTLEFKRADSLETTDSKKKEISKDISSFANCSGGIIVYGIEEKNNIAESISFIDGETFTKEWLEQVIQTNTQRKIEGLQIIPIRFEGEIQKTVYVVKIPQSNSSPHMARDKRYYKRYNFESVPMEEYEVRNLYNQTHKTDLSIQDLIVKSSRSTGNKTGGYREVAFYLQLKVKNEGNSVEQLYNIQLEIPNLILDTIASNSELHSFEAERDGTKIYKFPNKSPLFQDEEDVSEQIAIKINQRTFSDLKNFKIGSRLYYSNGIKYRVFDLLKILKIDGQTISEKLFTNY